MNNDVKDLILAKKEKINEWLEYLDSGDDDVIWIQKNRVFSTGLYNIIYQLQKIESNDFIKKQEELINTVGQYINNRDRLKVKEIVAKLKDLDDGKDIIDDNNFNDINTMINDIDNKLDELKQEELEGKTAEEQEKINEQWNKEEKEFEELTNSIINDIRNSNVSLPNNEEVKISKNEYESLKRCEEKYLKMQRCDFALIVNSGSVLPIMHPDYNNDRIKIEIYNVENNNVEIDGKNHNINTQVLFNKIKVFVEDKLDELIDWSKKETNQFLDNNSYEGGKSTNIEIKYGQLLIKVNGQVTGELKSQIDDFINELKKLIVNESNLNYKDYIANNLSDNNYMANDDTIDDDKIIELLINKIEQLNEGTQFTISKLINIDGIENNKEIDLIKITLDTLKKLEEKGIQVKPTVTGIVGLPQNIPYIKIGKKD